MKERSVEVAPHHDVVRRAACDAQPRKHGDICLSPPRRRQPQTGRRAERRQRVRGVAQGAYRDEPHEQPGTADLGQKGDVVSTEPAEELRARVCRAACELVEGGEAEEHTEQSHHRYAKALDERCRRSAKRPVLRDEPHRREDDLARHYGVKVQRGCRDRKAPPEIQQSGKAQEHEAPHPAGEGEREERTAEPNLGGESISQVTCRERC
jgi:hypothetical protein